MLKKISVKCDLKWTMSFWEFVTVVVGNNDQLELTRYFELYEMNPIKSWYNVIRAKCENFIE